MMWLMTTSASSPTCCQYPIKMRLSVLGVSLPSCRQFLLISNILSLLLKRCWVISDSNIWLLKQNSIRSMELQGELSLRSQCCVFIAFAIFYLYSTICKVPIIRQYYYNSLIELLYSYPPYKARSTKINRCQLRFDRSTSVVPGGRPAKQSESMERQANERCSFQERVMIVISAYGSSGKFYSNFQSTLLFIFSLKDMQPIKNIITDIHPSIVRKTNNANSHKLTRNTYPLTQQHHYCATQGQLVDL